MSNPAGVSALSHPLYGATFGQAVSRFFRKYATFSGRASLSEFWWAVLFLMVPSFVIVTAVTVAVLSTAVRRVDGSIDYGSPVGIAVALVGVAISIALAIPQISLTVRRLHDANYSGWNYLLSLVPSVGGIIILILAVLPSRPEGARFDR